MSKTLTPLENAKYMLECMRDQDSADSDYATVCVAYESEGGAEHYPDIPISDIAAQSLVQIEILEGRLRDITRATYDIQNVPLLSRLFKDIKKRSGNDDEGYLVPIIDPALWRRLCLILGENG